MSKKSIRLFLIVALLLAGIFIKAYYISYTETWQRQHDVIGFGAEEGHAAYIEYILFNGSLPDFDPREKWGFFQPPLHHIVSAETIKISKLFGADDHRAQENTQVMTCAYMLIVLLLTVIIFKQSARKYEGIIPERMRTKGFIVTLSVVGLHPIFTLMSGSINNDALALVLSLTAVVIAYYWDRKPTYFLTILLALTIGLAMFAKLTGGLVAVPVAILMIRKFFGFDGKDVKGKGLQIAKRFKLFYTKYLTKAIVFAAVVFPIGLYWTIRNKIKWGMPINYIPPVGENFAESITLKDRLLQFSTASVYPMLVNNGDAYDEYSLPLSMIKTSIFGEYNYSQISRWMNPLSVILFISAVCLSVIAVYAMCYVLRKKTLMEFSWKVLITGTWAVYFLAYLGFAISHTNFSAQDFRYAAICIVCQGVFLGVYVDDTKSKIAKYFITGLSLMFAACAFSVYFLLGLKS